MLVSDVGLSNEDRNELPVRRDIHHWRGNTKQIMFRLRNESGDGLDLSGYTCRCVVKPKVEYEDGDPGTSQYPATTTEVNSATVQDLTGSLSPNGYVFIYFDGAAADFAGGDYYYGIELAGLDSSGREKIITPMVGVWNQYEDVVDNA